MNTKRQYIAGLDGVRFLAAIFVVIYHISFCAWLTSERAAGSLFDKMATFPETIDISWFGWIGVEIFFVISGLVIANSARSAPTALSFLRHRAQRLYPAVWICAPITLLIASAYGLAAPSELVTRACHSMLLLPHGPWVEGVYWTLAVEIIFYLAVFLTLAWRGQGALHMLAIVLGVWSSAYLVYTMVAHLLHLPHIGTDVDRPLLLRYGVNFAVGMLLAESEDGSTWRDRAWLVAFVAMSALGIVLKAGFFADVTRAAGGSASRFTPAVFWLFAMALIMLSLRYRARILSFPPVVLRTLRAIGLATYPLYLIHPVLGSWLVRLGLLAGLSKWPALALAMALLVAVALFIAHTLEPRVRRLLHRALDAVMKIPRPVASGADAL